MPINGANKYIRKAKFSNFIFVFGFVSFKSKKIFLNHMILKTRICFNSIFSVFFKASIKLKSFSY